MKNKQLPPKAVSALVLGIMSIGLNVFSLPLFAFVLQDLLSSGSPSPAIIVFIVPSLLLSVLALNHARRGEDAVKQNPELYRSTSMLKVARVTAYMGAAISFAALILIWVGIRR